MRALATYILKGRLQAIGVTSVMTFVSMMLPPLAYLLSGIPVSLVSLRRGPVIGMHVMLGSLLVVIVLAWLLNIKPEIAMIFALQIWIPLWLCTIVLRQTESQGHLVFLAGMLGIAYVIISHLLFDDVVELWRDTLKNGFIKAFPADLASEYEPVAEQLAPYMNGMLAGSLLVSIVITVLFARWWQSLLFNPGEFKTEFYALRLPRILLLGVVIGVVLILMDMAQPGAMAFDMLLVLIFAYFFQGLAAIHRIVAEKGLPKIWLFLLYVLLLIPQVGLFVACLGMIDSWLQRPLDAGPKNNS